MDFFTTENIVRGAIVIATCWTFLELRERGYSHVSFWGFAFCAYCLGVYDTTVGHIAKIKQPITVDLRDSSFEMTRPNNTTWVFTRKEKAP